MSTIGHEKTFWTTNDTFSRQRHPFCPKHQISIWIKHRMTPLSLAVSTPASPTALWDSKAKRAWRSVHIAASHPSTWWTDQRLLTPSEAHNWPAGESETMWRQPDATVEGWWQWGAPEGERRQEHEAGRSQSRHATLGGNWKLVASNLWVAYYVAKGAGFVLGHHGTGGLTLLFAFLLQRLLEHLIREPEALLEEVDQRLAEVLPCSLVVNEVSFVWVDLAKDTTTRGMS